MFCPKCGNEVEQGAMFCPKCGQYAYAAGTGGSYKKYE